jgi:hypothetical protein
VSSNGENKRLQIRNNRIRLIRDYKKEKGNGTLTPEKERGYIEWLIINTQSARSLEGLTTGKEKWLGEKDREEFVRSFERQAKKDLGIEE